MQRKESLFILSLNCRQERRKEAERMAREREELRKQQEQLRYEQEKRSSLKRGRDVDHRYTRIVLLKRLYKKIETEQQTSRLLFRHNSSLRDFSVPCRREDSYWSNNKKVAQESGGRMNQTSDFNNRQQGRFNDRDRARYPDNATNQPNNFDR